LGRTEPTLVFRRVTPGHLDLFHDF
jgi:hypothetical protein